MRGLITAFLVVFFGSFFTLAVHAQLRFSNDFDKKLENFEIKPVVVLQLWASYTRGAEVFEETSGTYDAVDNRWNFQIRRSRLGFKGKVYNNLSFNFTLAMDLVNRDLLAGTEGGINNGGSPRIRPWNAWIRWKAFAESDAFHATIGYFLPQIGRESITSAFRSNSMEKSWSQNYLRRHLTGVGHGRSVGLNLGGMLCETDQMVTFSYDIGVFNPIYQAYGGNSTGAVASLLYVGRLAVHIGEPETPRYSTGHKVNYFGKRNGLTLALAGALEGATDLYRQNQALGGDFLFNWENWQMDGEWTWMMRKGSGGATVQSNTGYFRAGYNINFKNGTTLEPVIMLMQFNGVVEEDDQFVANALASLAGREEKLNVGFNYYLNPDLKLSLHYTARTADAGAAGDGATVNNYFFQGNLGAIHRGDWLGFGIVGIF